jgi:RHS repeat-associated protein
VAITVSGSLAALNLVEEIELAAMSAPETPSVISPLRVEPDVNGVNIVSGKLAIPSPSISIPAAPNLKFDGAQNAAPYVVEDTTGSGAGGGGAAVPVSAYSIHTGGGSSASFSCSDYSDCRSKTGDGSTFEAIVNSYTQAGSGAVYTFDLKHFQLLSNNKTQSQYYASKITYSNGEVISFAYDTYLQGSGTTAKTYYRPTTITSSLGYAIAVTYQSNTFLTFGWSAPAQATLYATANPGTALARLNYGAPVNGVVSITDLAGRIFKCSSCAFALGDKIEASSGNATLPTETNPAMQVNISGSGSGQLVGSIVRDGVTWTYTYANPRLNGLASGWIYDGVTVTGPNSYSQSYAINQVNLAGAGTQVNRISSTTDALGRTTSFVFDPTFRPTEMTMPEGNKVVLTYDLYGNITSKVTKAKPGSGLADITESAFVDTATCQGVLCYRPVWVRDGLGRQTDYVYNAAGQMTERTDPADANGVRRKTFTTYDATSGISRPTVVRVCGTGAACGTGDEIRTEYSYWGNTLLPLQERRIDAARGIMLVTDYSYDAAGRVLSVDGPLAGSDDAVYYRYDIVGRKIWEIGAAGQGGVRTAKRFTYRDADDKVTNFEMGTVPNPTSMTLSVLESTATAYDARRNPVRTWMLGQGSVYKVMDRSFDDRGQVECEAVRMNPAAFASLPTSACVAGAAGAQGPDRITRKLYDPASQLFKTIVAVGTADEADEVTYTFSSNGKAKSVADGLGNLTTYEFDGFDRLTKTRFPDATSGTVSSTTDYEALSYDAVGNVTQRRLRDGKLINLVYDNLNRLRVKDMPSPERDITYTYDARGGMTRVEDSGGLVVTMSYDALGRRLSEANLWTGFTFSYDAGGRRTRMTFSDGFYVNYDYLANGAMTHIRENGATTGVGVLGAYSYDGLGRMTTLTRGNGVVTSYQYDAVGRASQLGHDMAGTTHDVTWGFAYNAASQIASSTRSNDLYAWNGHGNVDRNYTVNGLNQLTTAGSTALGYDGRGNLTSSGTIGYTYDAESRLTSTASTNYNYGLGYDPMGRYFWNAGIAPTLLFYDGSAHVEERAQGSNALLRRYIHGPGADTPLVWYEGSGTTDKRWLIPDERGSIIAVTNASGAVTNVNRYDDYGVPAATNVGRFQYTGQAWVPELQMYYYKARIYAPTLGRFMQTDPTGYDDGPNSYDYVGGDPVNKSDPSGLCSTGSRVAGNNAVGCKKALGAEGDGSDAAGRRGSSAGASSAQSNQGASSVQSAGEQQAAGSTPEYGDGLQLVGYYNGQRTFGDRPTVGRSIVPFYPLGRINSGLSGGIVRAFNAIDYIAKLNGILPPTPVGTPVGNLGGWIYSRNGTNQILTHPSGLEFRANGAKQQINIDIPNGMYVAPGVRNSTGYTESVHFKW